MAKPFLRAALAAGLAAGLLFLAAAAALNLLGPGGAFIGPPAILDASTAAASGNVDGSVSFLFTRLGYYTTNGGRPPLLSQRRPHRPAVVIDVGMFSGEDYTKPCLKQGHRVYAFEVGENKIQVVHAWAKTNNISADLIMPVHNQAVHGMPDRRPSSQRPRLYLINAAASSKMGTATFVKSAVNSPVDTLEVDAEFLPCKQNCERSKVAVVRVDDFVDEDVWLLKIDTQGYDCHVLKGSERLLRNRRVEYITFEFAPAVMDSTGCTAMDALQFLHELGYKCYEWGLLAKGFGDDRSGQPFADYLRDFSISHEMKWVGHPWTDLLCVHKSLL